MSVVVVYVIIISYYTLLSTTCALILDKLMILLRVIAFIYITYNSSCFYSPLLKLNHNSLLLTTDLRMYSMYWQKVVS